MSSNQLNYDKNNAQLNAQRNCINFDGSKKFNVNYKAMAHDDKCFIDIQTRQSIGPGNYSVTNLYDCDCLMPQTVQNATDNVLMFFKNGYDVGSCVVDDSSKLRIGLTKRYPKCPQQLFERPYMTTPYMGKGYLQPDSESALIFSDDTRCKKSANTLSGVTIPQQFTPLLDHILYNVQNPVHLIEEVASPDFIRSGAPSRLVVRDFDYAAHCGKAYMNRSTNPDFWVKNPKGSLLNQ